MSQATPLSQQFPGGCYVGFNAGIDRKAAEQLVSVIANAVHQHRFAEINLCLSSIGGFLDQAYYAFNMIEALPVKLITWNTGNIQSAANILFLVGDERYATSGATFFFHQTSYDPASGKLTTAFLAERLKAAQYDDARSAAIIAAKTGRSSQDVLGWQNTELVMDTAQAIAHGLIHSVRQLIIPADALFHQVII
jgi:ATP-dependent protease ClpP protease subunit